MFKPSQAVKFTEAAKVLANNYNPDSGSATGVWYEGCAQAIRLLNAIPREIRRFDDALIRGQLAERIYRLNTKNRTQPSLSWELLKTQTEHAQAPTPQLPETNLPEVSVEETVIPLAEVLNPYGFFPGVLTKQVRDLAQERPRRQGEYWGVENRNVSLFWTDETTLKPKVVLLIEGGTVPSNANGL